MNPDHAHFADWDAAYVLGALSPSDRRVFEAHMQECDACRAAIVEAAPTLVLLSRVASDRAESLLDEPASSVGPDPALRRDVIARGVRESRRRRRTWWVAGAAAAAAIVVAVVITTSISLGGSTPPGGELVTLEAISDVPLTATVELVDVAWGTRLQMTCRYAAEAESEAAEQGWPYALVVTAVDGTTNEVSSWRALPGKTARIEAGTALDPDQIASFEVRSVSSGRVLMRTELRDTTGTG